MKAFSKSMRPPLVKYAKKWMITFLVQKQQLKLKREGEKPRAYTASATADEGYTFKAIDIKAAQKASS